MVVICPKCEAAGIKGKAVIAYNPIIVTISNKSGSFKYRVFRHPRKVKHSGKRKQKRCYVKLESSNTGS